MCTNEEDKACKHPLVTNIIVAYLMNLQFILQSKIANHANSSNNLCFYIHLCTLSASGGDYTPVTSVLTFTSGQTQVAVPVPILSDTVVEDVERFMAVLSAPSAGLTLGQASTASVDIQDATGMQRV